MDWLTAYYTLWYKQAYKQATNLGVTSLKKFWEEIEKILKEHNFPDRAVGTLTVGNRKK